jgi:hypothetical protein
MTTPRERQVEFDPETARALGEIDRLTIYAVVTRYPPRPGRTARSLADEQIRADVRDAFAACAVLDEAVRRRLVVLDPQTAADAAEGEGPGAHPMR